MANRVCLSINRPFVLARIEGVCYNSQHEEVREPCFDVNDEYDKHVSLYAAPSGIILSGSKQDSMNWGYAQSPSIDGGNGDDTITVSGNDNDNIYASIPASEAAKERLPFPRAERGPMPPGAPKSERVRDPAS